MYIFYKIELVAIHVAEYKKQTEFSAMSKGG